jgi:hypothetical protein
MIGALHYPLALVARRPFSMIAGFGLFIAILVGLDLGFEASGIDVVHTGSNDSGSRLEAFLSNFSSTFAGAMVMATAAIDLKRRDPEERPSPVDGLSQIVLNIKYSFMVLAPAGVLAFASGIALWSVSQLAAIAVVSLVVLAWLYVSVRLYLAWPLAVSEGSGRLWRAWPLSRGKVWPLLGMLALIYLIGAAAPFAVGAGLALLSIAPGEPVASLDAALTPRALGVLIGTNASIAVLTFYTSAAAMALYNAADPSKVNVADEF